MANVRKAAVAGLFYPADAAQLRQMVEDLLAAAEPDGPPPKALIAPHAGFIYSGPTAAHAYGLVRSISSRIERVVLIGPAHRVPFQGVAGVAADAFQTPLGFVPVDREALESLRDLEEFTSLDAAHGREHSLETQLPFLQQILGGFRIVPLLVGEADPAVVTRVLDRLWGGPETLIVISSDLSHFHDYRTAQRLDAATSAAILECRPDAIDYADACGALPVRGLLEAARARQLDARLLDLRNSGDTAGDRNRVVGYGAYAFG